MKSNSLSKLMVEALEDLKAVDIRVLDVRHLTDITDYMIVATARSSRQISALTDNVLKRAKQRRQTPLGVEGKDDGEWALVDMGDVVVHIMQAEVRDLYQLEKLWSAREKIPAEQDAASASA